MLCCCETYVNHCIDFKCGLNGVVFECGCNWKVLEGVPKKPKNY